MRHEWHVLATLAALGAGLFGGLAVTAQVLDARRVPGATRVGVWVAWPRAGAPDADPYTRALHARRGEVAMTPAEGLALHAFADEQGEPLRGGCSYVLTGRMPPARAWTLAAYRPDGSLPANAADRHVVTSADAVGGAQPEVAISAAPTPGNWLPLPSAGPVTVVLRLYDTPLSSVAVALEAERLPTIRRTGCG